MMDDIYLGESPCDEDCAQVGSDGYGLRARAECQALIHQIRRQLGPEPSGAALCIKGENHDYGRVYSVHCKFEETNEIAVAYAFKAEAEYPQKWDKEAKQELRGQEIMRQMNEA